MRPAALTALTRFGLGPRPGDIAAAGGDPRGFVLGQLADPAAIAIDAGLAAIDTIRDRHNATAGAILRERRAGKAAGSVDAAALKGIAAERRAFERPLVAGELDARVALGLATDHPFLERLVLFFSNHFAIQAQRGVPLDIVVGNFERSAIRANLGGRFAAMLAAATLHPAMLMSLNNDVSVGSVSRIGRPKVRQLGRRPINENLARELLELHTLGVDGGYGQDDVVELAEVLSGWTGGFGTGGIAEFDPDRHSGGRRTVLGRRYPDDGPDQIRAVLADLARHPATARHLAGKLARHVVGDAAPAALVAALAATFRDTDGDLLAVAATLAGHDAAWAGPARKSVPPYDFLLAAGRALGTDRMPPGLVRSAARTLAQAVWSPPSPAGWPDADDAFLGGDALLKRIDVANDLAGRLGRRVDPRALGEDLFGDTIDPALAAALARAGDRGEGVLLLLMCPALQRR